MNDALTPKHVVILLMVLAIVVGCVLSIRSIRGENASAVRQQQCAYTMDCRP